MAGEIKKVLFSEGVTVSPPSELSFDAADITGVVATANGGTGISSTATFPASGVVAVITDITTATAGLKPKQSVLVATTANITLSGEQTIDTILTSASRVLVKNQSTQSQNGIYLSSSSGWTRATDFDNMTEIPSAHVFVERGSQADTGWTCTSDAATVLNTDPITFTQFSGPGSFDSSSPMTANGDLITRAAGVGARLPIGSTGQILTVAGGAPTWATNAAVPVTTKGDLFTFDTAAARLPVGVNGQTLQVDSATATGIKWGDGSAGGSGELNMVSNPSAASAVTPWAAAGGTWANPTRTTTSGDLPLENQVATALKIISPTVDLAESGHYVGITMTPGEGLKNKKLKVEFYMRPGTNFVASEWTVSVYSGATRMSLSTDSAGKTFLPNATGKFTTTFETDSSSSYTLRFARIDNILTNAAVLNVTNVIVGPGIQPQGAVVGKVTPWTPTVNNLGTGSLTIAEGKYYQDGEVMVFSLSTVKDGSAGTGTGVLEFVLPAGLTINLSGLPNTSSYNNERNKVGDASVYGIGSAIYNGSYPVLARSSTAVSVINPGTASQLTGANYSANATITITGCVPIAEWTGSGTVNLAQNDVEYLSNSDETTSSNSSSANAKYSQEGAIVPSGALGASINKKVFFKYPMQAGESLSLQVNDGSGWVNLSSQDIGTGVQPFQYQNGGEYGIGIRWGEVTATTANVYFGRYKYANGLYGAAGSNWAGGLRWRVVKCTANQAVGFGMATATQSGLISRYEENTWDPLPFSLTNLTGTPTTAEAKYTRIGRLVAFQFKISGTSVTSASTQTSIQFKYPIAQTADGDMCGGACYIAIAPYVAAVADSTGGNGTDGSIVWQSTSTGSLVIHVSGRYML